MRSQSIPIDNQVIVITGGSSGIGREAALLLSRRAATVVLIARGETALRAVADEITHAGHTVTTIVADVADPDQIHAAVDRIIDEHGHIDTWINNAAVAAYATVEQLTVEEIDRMLAVDLHGVIYSCKAVLPRMIERGGGTIINVGSGLGERALPLMSMYCAAKAGVKAFTEALRVELARDHPSIAVTLIVPSSINTPFYSHARSKRGRAPRPYPPVYDVALAARAIVHAVEHPRREIHVGGAARLLGLLDRLSPGLIDRYLLQGDRAHRNMLAERSLERRDNLFASPDQPATSRGQFGAETARHSPYTYAVLHPARALLSFAAAGALAFAWRWQSQRMSRAS